MRVILSRKGFDSENGGYASPILPNGRLASFPIPNPKDDVQYSNLTLNMNESYFDLMTQVLPKKIKTDNKREKLTRKTKCHLDPDINRQVQPRLNGWRGCFGQGDNAQAHLKKYNIGKGDIFLFFGGFKRATLCNSNFKYIDSTRHVIFGYLEIDNVVNPRIDDVPRWLRSHPHNNARRKKKANNAIYIAKETVSWNSSLPGYGVFNFHKNLVLTKQGISKSKWNLPNFFREVNITYHSKASWKEDYFQSASRGQEFIIDENDKIECWTKDLINICAS